MIFCCNIPDSAGHNMKKIKSLIMFLMMAAALLTLTISDAQDMMGQYREMSAGTEKNFPPELVKLMPAGFSIKSKGFIFKETANMFLFTALSGTRKNDVYVKFGHTAEIEIGVMAYNPQSAAYMKDQMPVVIEQLRSGYSEGTAECSGDWECEPVTVTRSGRAEIYIQKSTRKNVEIDNLKHEDQVYYYINAVCLNKNALLQVRLIYYPLNREKADAAVNEIVKNFLATDFNRYMK